MGVEGNERRGVSDTSPDELLGSKCLAGDAPGGLGILEGENAGVLLPVIVDRCFRGVANSRDRSSAACLPMESSLLRKDDDLGKQSLVVGSSPQLERPSPQLERPAPSPEVDS